MKNLKVEVIKIARSHATQAMVDARIISEEDRVGNEWADKFAEMGASLSPVKEEEIAQTNAVYRDARYVQVRLAQASALLTTGARGTRSRAIPPPAPPAQSRKRTLDHLDRRSNEGSQHLVRQPCPWHQPSYQ